MQEKFPFTPQYGSHLYNHPFYHGFHHGYPYNHGHHPYGHHHYNHHHSYYWQWRPHAAVTPGHPLYNYYNEYQVNDQQSVSNLNLSIDAKERSPGQDTKTTTPGRFPTPNKMSKGKSNQTPIQKHPRTSVAIDTVDPVYHHLDPISVSLQERVKFGGHISSVIQKPYHKIPFYFILSEKDQTDHISKRAIFSREIEIEEARDRGVKVNYIKKDLLDKKAIERDYQEALQAREIQRIEAEAQRRERDIQTNQDKYFDPEAFE